MLRLSLILLWCIISEKIFPQIIIPDFQINDGTRNTNGVWRTAITTMSNGSFAVAWQDFNDYNSPLINKPRIAVQLFNSDGIPQGPLNLFNGESRALSIWTSDYLTENIDIEFAPNGTLLIAAEHQGDFSLGGVDHIFSSEAGIGAVSSTGEIIDLSNSSGVIYWLIPLALRNSYNPRIDAAPDGRFIFVLHGDTYQTGFHAVAAQAFQSDGNPDGDFITPHLNDPGPQSNHRYPDIATNGTNHLIAWQNGSQDNNYDISAQFYNNNGPLGSIMKVNQNDPVGTTNVIPSVSMNSSGSSVIVWIDSRNNPNGEIFGQLFDSNGQYLGSNFQISAGDGTIWDRPETAMLNDGSFMVVWTDSSNTQGLNALRARGRQFDASGIPLTPVFIIPDQDAASGLVTISSDGQKYFLAWIDARNASGNPNVFCKVISKVSTDVSGSENIPITFGLNQNYPNPFNPETKIRWQMPEDGHVVLKVLDILGNEVSTILNEERTAGTYTTRYNADGVTSGVYFYKIQISSFNSEIGSYTEVKKMVILK